MADGEIPLWCEIDEKGRDLSIDPYLERLKVTKEGDRVTLLKKLVRAQIAEVPFENLDVYGSVKPLVEIDIQKTYDKIVEKNRGGFCFEVNLLFGWLLRRLGYDAKFAAARVWRGDDPTVSNVVDAADVLLAQSEAWDGSKPPTHIIVIVRLDQLFVCDVGFGDVPRTPLVLGQDNFDGHHTYRFAWKTPSLIILNRLSDGSSGLNGIRSVPGTPEPRILFDLHLDRPKSNFVPGLLRCQTDETSLFRRFLLAVRHPHDGSKCVLYGRRLRLSEGGDTRDIIFDTSDTLLDALTTYFFMRFRSEEDATAQVARVQPAIDLALRSPAEPVKTPQD